MKREINFFQKIRAVIVGLFRSSGDLLGFPKVERRQKKEEDSLS